MTIMSAAPGYFAETIRHIRERSPQCRVEVLIPDFQGNEEALRVVLDARPDVLNHNTESVPPTLRVRAFRSPLQTHLDLLTNAKKFSPGMVTKSGLMVGLGETTEELVEAFTTSATVAWTSSQSDNTLRPSRDHLPIARFYAPEEFVYLRGAGVTLRLPPRGIRPHGALQLSCP